MESTAALTKPVRAKNAHSQYSDLESVLEWMNGNGKPGAKTRLALLEDRFVNLDEKIDKVDKKLDRIMNWVLGIAATIIGGLLIYLFTNLIPKWIAHVG